MDELPAKLKLDWIVLFSSISSIKGNIGQADYASANKFLDNYAEYRNLLEAKGENFDKNEDLALNRKVEIIYKEIDLIDQIKNLKIGEKLIIKNLNFYNNSGNVLPESKPVLEQLLDIMNKIPKLKIEIQGHICCQTLDGSNKIEDIAKIRAYAVYNFLIFGGINPERLNYVSFKSSKPIYPIPEKTEEERIANRRVEIMILDI